MMYDYNRVAFQSPGVPLPPENCSMNVCANNGWCRSTYGVITCDCAGTGFIGDLCQQGNSINQPQRPAALSETFEDN